MSYLIEFFLKQLGMVLGISIGAFLLTYLLAWCCNCDPEIEKIKGEIASSMRQRVFYQASTIDRQVIHERINAMRNLDLEALINNGGAENTPVTVTITTNVPQM